MAEIIQFKQSEDYYIEQSVSWSGRGDHFKSLLYARSANESGSLRSHMRLAQALYESGNFERSAESYLSLYAGGLRSGELYAGIIKSLAAMSRFRSAAFFVKEARDCGALENMPSGDVLSRGEFNRALADIIRKYRDASQPSAFARTLYIVSRGDVSADDTFIYDLYLSEGDNAATDALFRSASVLTKDKLNRPLAQKLLSACDETLSSGEPRQDVLAAKIIALVSLDRLEEADAVADDLLAMELPESDLDMLKCGIAMLELGYYEGRAGLSRRAHQRSVRRNAVVRHRTCRAGGGGRRARQGDVLRGAHHRPPQRRRDVLVRQTGGTGPGGASLFRG